MPRSARTGFDLLELVVVVTIVATVAAIALPRYADALVRYRADAAAGRIVTDLAYAQASARRSSTNRTVAFDVAGNGYQIAGLPHLNNPAATYALNLGEEPYRVRLAGAEFQGLSDSDVVFDGFGQPDSGGSIKIQIGGQERTITLDPDTGRAAFQ